MMVATVSYVKVESVERTFSLVKGQWLNCERRHDLIVHVAIFEGS